MSLEAKRSDGITQGYCIQAKRTKMLTLGTHKYLQDGIKKKERMLKKKSRDITESFKNAKGIISNLKSAWHGN